MDRDERKCPGEGRLDRPGPWPADHLGVGTGMARHEGDLEGQEPARLRVGPADSGAAAVGGGAVEPHHSCRCGGLGGRAEPASGAVSYAEGARRLVPVSAVGDPGRAPGSGSDPRGEATSTAARPAALPDPRRGRQAGGGVPSSVRAVRPPGRIHRLAIRRGGRPAGRRPRSRPRAAASRDEPRRGGRAAGRDDAEVTPDPHGARPAILAGAAGGAGRRSRPCRPALHDQERESAAE